MSRQGLFHWIDGEIDSMRSFLIFFALIVILAVSSASAQDQCAVLLGEAEDKYDQGRLYEVPVLIENCLEVGFTQEEKIRAYRLLTLTYLYLDYEAKADSSYLSLLKLSPEYATNEELDPKEIVNHHEKFTTKPIYYLSMIKLGVNFSFANVLTDYSLSVSRNNSDSYSSGLGFQLGVGAEMVVKNNFHIAGEFFISQSQLHLTDNHFGFFTTDMDINHTRIELPIMLKYNFNEGIVRPFVLAGVSPNMLISSSITNIEGVYRESDEDFPVQARPEIGTGKLRTTFNYSLLLGGGFHYKIGLNYLSVEARYSKGMLNMTDTKNRWREDFSEGRDLKFPSGHVDDDFKIDNVFILVGFVKPLYKPSKIK